MGKVVRSGAPATSTWSIVFSVLGFIGSAMAVVSLIKRGFDIEVGGIPAVIYSEYQKYRDFIFSIIPFALSQFTKDVIVFYLLMASGLYRSYSTLDVRDLDPNFKLSWKENVRAAALWPVYLIGLPFIPKDEAEAITHGRILRGYLVALVIIVVAAAAYFGWNQLSK